MSTESNAPSLLTVILVSFITSASVSIGVVFGASQISFNDEKPPETVDVPVVVNMTPTTAGELLEGRGLRLVVAGEKAHADVPPGSISEQSPLAGSKVDRGMEVRVFVATGPAVTKVPTLVGKPLADAKAALDAAGLTVGAIEEGGSGAPETVSASTPEAGTEVPLGSPVALKQVPAGGAVPEVVGLSRKKAKEALVAAGFQEGKIKWRFNDNKSPFVVLEQDPPAGTTLPPGSAVDLVLNEE